MRKALWTGVLVSCTVATVVVTSAVTASAGNAGPAPAQPGAPRLAGLAVTATAPQSTYTAITPCRIVDTRIASARNLQPGARRDFAVSGTTLFVPQGGTSGGCGVPAAAVAVTASMSVTDVVGGGYLKAWARGGTEPTATALLLARGSGSFTGTTVPVSASGMSVRPVGGGGRLVVDVTGYFAPPVSAVIGNLGGVLAGGTRVVSATRTGVGSYSVVADRDLTGCAASATMDGGQFYVTADIEGGAVVAQTWFVNAGGPVLADLSWSLVVTC
jgi:hypothetical protein